MLTQQLRDLERNGLVKRTFHEKIPLRVGYSVTELGRSVDLILVAMWLGGGALRIRPESAAPL